MANTKVTSAPLFGSASPGEVKAIQKRMQIYTQRLIKDAERARKVLRETGATDDPAR
jgi:hypothetical protein